MENGTTIFCADFPNMVQLVKIMIFLKNFKKIYIILNGIFSQKHALYVLLQNLKIRIEQGQRSLVLSEQIVSFTVILQLVCL